MLTERRTINASPNVTKSISYTYNLASGVTTITYPSGRVITYTYSAIGRTLTAKDVPNNINYVTDALYAPPGGLASLKNGVVTGGFAGIIRTNAYNNRLQGSLLSAAAPSQTVFSLSYGYGTSNNGQIASIVNNLSNNRTQSFTYDTLRRLATAQSQATSGADCWGQSFGYDRWANKSLDTVTKCTAPALNVTIASGTNRITTTGFAYDNAGDLTNENGPTYTWNAEQQITAAAGVTYTYDGDGLRVKKSNGKMYWRGTAISVLAESDLGGNTTMEYVYFAGQRMAARDASGNVYYLFEDHRGSTVAATDANGVPCFDADYFPYGADNLKVNNCPQAFRFATYERDSESGLDYAIFRYYNSRLGRFMSPDPVEGDIANPQSLNKYAYVLNDPVNLTDPQGLFESHRPPIPPLCDEDPESEGEYGFPIPSDDGSGGGGITQGGGGAPPRVPETTRFPVFDAWLALRLNLGAAAFQAKPRLSKQYDCRATLVLDYDLGDMGAGSCVYGLNCSRTDGDRVSLVGGELVISKAQIEAVCHKPVSACPSGSALTVKARFTRVKIFSVDILVGLGDTKTSIDCSQVN